MTATSTLTSKNQTTLPKAVIAALGVKPADELLYEIEGDRVTLRPRKGSVADLARMRPLGPKPARAFSVVEINRAVAAGYAAHGARKTRGTART